MATVSDGPIPRGCGVQPALPPQVKASWKYCPTACRLGHPAQTPAQIATADATPWPLALSVNRPGATGATSTLPIVWVPSPLETVIVAGPGCVLVGT